MNAGAFLLSNVVYAADGEFRSFAAENANAAGFGVQVKIVVARAARRRPAQVISTARCIRVGGYASARLPSALARTDADRRKREMLRRGRTGPFRTNTTPSVCTRARRTQVIVAAAPPTGKSSLFQPQRCTGPAPRPFPCSPSRRIRAPCVCAAAQRTMPLTIRIQRLVGSSDAGPNGSQSASVLVALQLMTVRGAA